MWREQVGSWHWMQQLWGPNGVVVGRGQGGNSKQLWGKGVVVGLRQGQQQQQQL